MLGIFSKKKVIVAGVAIFGGIAMATTGFASWVFGIVQNATTGDVSNVTVETTSNQNVVVLATLAANESVKFAEPSDSIYNASATRDAQGNLPEGNVTDDDNIYFKAEEPSADLDITFSEISLSYGHGSSPSSLAINLIDIYKVDNAETTNINEADDGLNHIATSEIKAITTENATYSGTSFGLAETGRGTAPSHSDKGEDGADTTATSAWHYVGIKSYKSGAVSSTQSLTFTFGIPAQSTGEWTLTYNNGTATDSKISTTGANSVNHNGATLTVTQDDDGSTTWTISNFVLHLWFGDYFASKSPCDFYQSGIPAGTVTPQSGGPTVYDPSTTSTNWFDTAALNATGYLNSVMTYITDASTEMGNFEDAVSGSIFKLGVVADGTWSATE